MSHSWHFTFFDISYAFWILLSFSNFIRVRSFSFIFFRVLKSVSNVVFRHPRKRVGGRSHSIRSPSQMTSSPAINCERGRGMTSYFPLPTPLERIRLRISSLYAWFRLFLFIFLLVFVTYGKSSWSWSFSQGLDGRVEKLATGTLALRAATRT